MDECRIDIVRKCRGDHTFLTIDDEEPIDKCDRKGENPNSEKHRKYLDDEFIVKVEISREKYSKEKSNEN
jgi:hypothetical protein